MDALTACQKGPADQLRAPLGAIRYSRNLNSFPFMALSYLPWTDSRSRGIHAPVVRKSLLLQRRPGERAPDPFAVAKPLVQLWVLKHMGHFPGWDKQDRGFGNVHSRSSILPPAGSGCCLNELSEPRLITRTELMGCFLGEVCVRSLFWVFVGPLGPALSSAHYSNLLEWDTAGFQQPQVRNRNL